MGPAEMRAAFFVRLQLMIPLSRIGSNRHDIGGVRLASIFILFFLMSIVFFVLHIALCVWAFRDCRRRGKNTEMALVVMAGLFFFPVMGLIVYVLIRNEI
jgi:uncharacterized membrane protein YhaH (DUF805 family)